MTKTIYIDLDGTLLGKNASLLHNAKGERSDVGVDALAKAEKAGFDLVIATGRDHLRAHEFARVIGLKNYIAELGCFIRHDDTEVIDYGPTVDKLIANKELTTEQFLEKLNAAANFVVNKFSGSIEIHKLYNRDRNASLMLKGNVDVNEVNLLLNENGWPYLEMNSNGHGRPSDTIPDVAQALIYHIVPLGISKASGVAKDQELRHLDKENCFMIGDGMADLLCSELVNSVYVPSNGVECDVEVGIYAEEHDNVLIMKESHNEGFAHAIDLIIGS